MGRRPLIMKSPCRDEKPDFLTHSGVWGLYVTYLMFVEYNNLKNVNVYLVMPNFLMSCKCVVFTVNAYCFNGCCTWIS